MFAYMKYGWKLALGQPFLLVTLFLYRFAWGITLYKLVQSVVIPLLHRYPGKDIPADQMQLFLAESEFQLTKTDLSESYLWLLLILLLARMLATPFLNAGIYYSLEHPKLNPGYRFIHGIKLHGFRFLLYYAVKIILILAPLFYLWPKFRSMLDRYVTDPSGLLTALPWLICYLIYGLVLHLLFMHLQFGITSGRSPWRSVKTLLSSMIPILCVAIMIFVLTGFVSLALLASAMVWAGFWAFILYHLAGVIRIYFRLWALSAQREIYLDKNRDN